MKTKKDLAWYLADYIGHEEDKELTQCGRFISPNCDLLKQGLEAFESTEQVQIKIIDVID